MLKVALAGVGGISGAHIPVWQTMEEAELVALCDIRPAQMEKYENIHTYTDFDEMLEKEDIDILDICLPTYLHADFSIKAMQRGIHVICEKPVSLHPEDVARVYRASEENHVKFMIAQVLRFWPEYEYLKTVYEQQTYGKLLSGTMLRLGSRPGWSWDGWMTDEKRSGLVPFDLHIHDLDFIVYAFGKPNRTVTHRSKRPDQDFLSVTYEFDSFFLNTEAAWYAAAHPFTAEFRFQFEDAVIVYAHGKLSIYKNDGTVLDNVLAGQESDLGDIQLPKSGGYENEIRYFTACVLEDRQPDKVKADELKAVLDILHTL